MSQARRSRKQSNVTDRNAIGTGLREIIPIFFGFAGLYLFISLSSYYPLDPGWSHSSGEPIDVKNIGGFVGAMFADIFFTLFGYFAYLFPVMVAYLGWLIYKGRHHDLLAEPKVLILPAIGFVMTLSAGCGLAIVHFSAETAVLPSHAGGILGTIIGKNLVNIINPLGATLLLLALFFTGITLLTGLSWLKLMDLLGEYTLRYVPLAGLFIKDRAIPGIVRFIQTCWRYLSLAQQKVVAGIMMLIARFRGEAVEAEAKPEAKPEQKKRQPQGVVKQVAPSSGKAGAKNRTTSELTTQKTNVTGRSDKSAEQPIGDESEAASSALETQIRKSLRKAVSGISVKSIQQGPLLLKVEAVMPEQTPDKLDKIYNKLSADLQTDKIRIFASNQDSVVLEIPHSDSESVYLSGLLIGNAYRESRSALTIALGKDIEGKPVVTDLTRMPHPSFVPK
ncbi:MAG: DNA translocase FtsK 4TM domain-containing protein, partial [Pseudomonadota bacterium]